MSGIELSCGECGEFTLEVPAGMERERVLHDYREAFAIVGRCPGCVSTSIRRGGDTSRAIWFDLDSQEWYLRHPIDGAGVSLPLGVRTFFADPEEILTAAERLEKSWGA